MKNHAVSKKSCLQMLHESICNLVLTNEQRINRENLEKAEELPAEEGKESGQRRDH